MPLKHLLILLFIAIAHGSAFPFTKLVLNDSVPPILMASLRMGLVLAILIPFWKFKIPEKKYLPSLIAFSISMGVCTYAFMYYSLSNTSLVAPIVIGAQLAIPFGLILSLIFLNERISTRKWFMIFISFTGIVVIAFDPKFIDERLALFFCILMEISKYTMKRN